MTHSTYSTGRKNNHVRPTRRALIAGSIAGLAGSAAAPLFAQAGTQMRMSWWGSDDRNQKTLAVIDLFEGRHPGLEIRSNFGGFLGYHDKLLTEFAGNNAPDIMQIGTEGRVLADAGRLLELDPYIESGALDLSNVAPALIDQERINGKLYNLPWGLFCGCHFLDTVVFEQAGVELPGNDWTWDEFAEKAKAISVATPEGVYGAADIWAPAGTRALPAFEVFLRQRGNHAFTPEGELGFTSDQLVEWLTFWDDLRLAGAVPPAQITALEGGFETSPIITKRTAMYPINSSIASSLQALTEHPLTILALPNGRGSEALSGDRFGQFVSGIDMTLNAQTEHKDLAVAFLNFITNEPEAAKIHLMARGVPINPAVVSEIEGMISPIEQSMASAIGYVQQEGYGEVINHPSESKEIEDAMQRMHQLAAFERASVQEAVEQFFEEASQILS